MKHEEVTSGVISAFYKVYNTLGYGFLEKVYENSLCLELKELGYKVETQKEITVLYHGQSVGKYYADLLINGNIILELKAVECLRSEHRFQLINYLKATGIEVGLLLNFGKSAEVRRVVYSHEN